MICHMQKSRGQLHYCNCSKAQAHLGKAQPLNGPVGYLGAHCTAGFCTWPKLICGYWLSSHIPRNYCLDHFCNCSLTHKVSSQTEDFSRLGSM